MNFIKTTLIGGLLFLVPIVALVLVVNKALDLMLKVAEPVADFLPIDTLAGVAIVNVVAAAIVVIICFVAGLAAYTAPAKRVAASIENAILSKIPGYSLVKGATNSLTDSETEDVFPVLVRLDGSARVGIEMERFGAGRVVTFLPSSPNAWTGQVHIVDAAQVERLDCSLTKVLDHAEQLGRGSHEYLTKS
jgi:uncharacterized membrane protein